MLATTIVAETSELYKSKYSAIDRNKNFNTFEGGSERLHWW